MSGPVRDRCRRPGEDMFLELDLFSVVDGVANDVLLVDDFESGDTAYWSTTVGEQGGGRRR